MADSTASAWIGASGALIALVLTQFLAEKYRRFKDGSALASGLAGELTTQAHTKKILIDHFDKWAKGQQRDGAAAFLRPFERPKDLFYEESVGKLGLLGVDLVEDIVFVYTNIRAFRNGLEVLCADERP
ncbi:hypothetical protein [Variovorax sp. GB1P17]|uniref:hypothetical protein n=1 Tax=Variovorax sp. GB1P17 TaxID=3443740 RepID=UPI003F4857E0